MTQHTYSTCLHTPIAHTIIHPDSNKTASRHVLVGKQRKAQPASLSHLSILAKHQQKKLTQHTHMYRARKPSLSVLLLSNGLNRGKGSGAIFVFSGTRGASGNHFVSYFYFVFPFLLLSCVSFSLLRKIRSGQIVGTHGV